jgi:excisionase family DNA binding protein
MTDRLAILAARMRSLQRRPSSTPVVIQVAPSAPTLSPDSNALLTLADAAQICKVHPRTLRTWPLPFVQVGRVVRIRRTDLDAFLATATEVRTDKRHDNLLKHGA